MRIVAVLLANGYIWATSVAQPTPTWLTDEKTVATPVSCVFRYVLPTGTNLPSAVIDQFPPALPITSEHETDTSSSTADGSDYSLEPASTESDTINLPTDANVPKVTIRNTSMATLNTTVLVPSTSAPHAPTSLLNASTPATSNTTTPKSASKPPVLATNATKVLDVFNTTTTPQKSLNTTSLEKDRRLQVTNVLPFTPENDSDASNDSSRDKPTTMDTIKASNATTPALIPTVTNSSSRNALSPSLIKSFVPINSSTESSSNGYIKDLESTATLATFQCDATFYNAWSRMGLQCGNVDLDVASAISASVCSIYSGTSTSTVIADMATCMSICRFPACKNGTWDYTAIDGLSSEIYAHLDFITLMTYAGPDAARAVTDAVPQPFSDLSFVSTSACNYESDASFSTCACAAAIGVQDPLASSPRVATAPSNTPLHYAVPTEKGLGDAHHWPDGKRKSSVDQVGIVSTTLGRSAATVSVVASSVLSVASGVVGSTSAGVASSVSAAASVGITLAAVDVCQFSIMLTQLNVDARPRFMENMGKQMAPAAFTFLPFGKISTIENTTTPRRRLTTEPMVQGMEKYALLIGVESGMLFYVAVAGIAVLVASLFGMYALAMAVCFWFVRDFTTFALKWLDKAIGGLVMLLILSEYVIGATATFQICFCIEEGRVDIRLVLAILTLGGLAFGTILYGVIVIQNNEDELRDLGTKTHFNKQFHVRYGPLYDEHRFEGRFFFAPKLLLALFCGMTTGMVWIQGLWQIIVLIALHVAFLLYLEMKQPYPTAFVQKTSSFVILIKISALGLSFFLLSSATRFTASIPDDLRQGVAFAIVGLQVLVLVCLMIRQVYIFYRTWQLKREGGESHEKRASIQTTNARDDSESFFAMDPHAEMRQLKETTPRGTLTNGQYETPLNGTTSFSSRAQLRNLQPHAIQRTHSAVGQHEGPSYRMNEVDL
ncbi:hypothetical protein CCR75_006243 [Bremia lactucae]|uniref:TRP C-terminal domain-containing protein n=1 Tax=Bremia lactucae TaxID=4779 RepID=A0A976FGT2_BRELC|nr:hypothetical protein CCR75_006243 [Bremia lactucae]